MLSGLITKGIGGFYYVETKDGLYECRARGIFRKEGTTPLPGDNVEISVIDTTAKTGYVEKIKPRINYLVRPAVANIDQMIIVISLQSPQPDFELLDRLLITSEKKHMQAVICVNKMDLVTKEELSAIIDIYKNTGYKIFSSSSIKNEGVFDLLHVMNNKITVFAGQSGVGKSTLLNRIMSDKIMPTGNVSKRIDRGKHTTRHAQLVALHSGGYIVDTPGFSSFAFEDITSEELELYYPEFKDYLYTCRFKGCSHIKEPECSIKDAVEAGKISLDRYERYCKFYKELKDNEGY